jgi:hypothetical protein
MTDEEMSPPGVRRPRHAVERECDALLQPARRHIAVEGGRLVGTELAGPVFGPRHAVRRHLRVQFERQPADLRFQLEFLECAFQPALAEEAPGANHVREDRNR